MKKLKSILLIITSIVFFACGGSDKAIETSEQKNIDVSFEDADKYQIDINNSNILWEGKKVTGSHNGSIKIKEGAVYMKNKELVGGKISIDMNSIVVLDIKDESMNARLVEHLKSDDFFSVDEFQISEFEIIEAIKYDDKYNITGNLTIKDITHSITFESYVKIKNGKYYATANINIDRTLWNVKYGSEKFFNNLKNNMINDVFNLQINVVTE